jgi:hypothetical protein
MIEKADPKKTSFSNYIVVPEVVPVPEVEPVVPPVIVVVEELLVVPEVDLLPVLLVVEELELVPDVVPLEPCVDLLLEVPDVELVVALSDPSAIEFDLERLSKPIEAVRNTAMNK